MSVTANRRCKENTEAYSGAKYSASVRKHKKVEAKDTLLLHVMILKKNTSRK
jgi:hypothetical protein